MEKDMSKVPLNISFDTQLVPIFLLPEEFDEIDIIRQENIKQNSKDYYEQSDAYNSQKLLLQNYCCLKFLRHLLAENKLHLNITPTAYSETMTSQFLEEKFSEMIADNDYDISNLIPETEIRQIVVKHIKHIKTISLDAINQLTEHTKNFRDFMTPLSYLRTPNKTLIKDIQTDLFNRLKERVFYLNLQDYEDSVKFIYFPYKTSILENGLAKDILSLSEAYRIDRKRTILKGQSKKLSHSRIPISEINDCTIMATSSLLSLPLISEDAKALSTKIDVYKDENKIFNSRHSDRRAIGEPFSPSDFIITFFKDEFLEFIKDFEVPEEISSVDKENLIARTIQSIKDTPVSVIGKKPSQFIKIPETERCAINRERYNNSFENATWNKETELLSPKEFLEDINSTSAENAKHSVSNTRKIHSIIWSFTIEEELNRLDSELLNLENAFWGFGKRDGNTISLSKKDVNLTRVATISKECLYKLLVIINHILKSYLYGEKEVSLPNKIQQILKEHNLECLSDGNGNIYGLAFEGISFTFPSNKTKEDIEFKKLAIEYDSHNLTDKSALLLSTNRYTCFIGGLTSVLNTYLKRFRSSYGELAEKNHYSASDIFDHIRSLDSAEDEEYSKRNMQIDDFIFQIKQL